MCTTVYEFGGELEIPLGGDWRKTKEPIFNMVDVCVVHRINN